MAPAYKLTYFNVPGAAETVRFLFKYGGIDFEDIRVTEAEWKQQKNETPFGQLPILEHDGKVVNQSKAIARYVAAQVNLSGRDDWENVQIDAVVETLQDLIKEFIQVIRVEKDEAVKKEKMETLMKETLPFYLDRFEAQVKENNGYFVGGRLTWADFSFVATAENLTSKAGTGVFSKYPCLAALIDKVYLIPAIKKWVETRPKADVR